MVMHTLIDFVWVIPNLTITIYASIPKRLKGSVLKTERRVKPCEGSNPSTGAYFFYERMYKMNWVFWFVILLICGCIWLTISPSFKPLSQIIKEYCRDVKDDIMYEGEENER